jgi:sugar phosphate permease
MQIPVGWLLDNRSPRKTVAILLSLGGGGGALVFSLAQGPMGIYAAMMMIGIGCSPVLMVSFYIFARTAPSHLFGTLAGLIVGIGSLGNLAASLPLSFSLELIGWRSTAIVLAAVTVLVSATLFLFIKDPERVEAPQGAASGGLMDILKDWRLYPIFAVALINYAPAAGLRGSWSGAYLGEVFGMDVVEIGRATAFMAIAMICGSLAFGPIDRIVRNRKVIVLTGVTLMASFLTVLWLTAGSLSVVMTMCLFVAIGFFGSTYGQVMNHGRSLMPAHLTGRGVTLINLFSMGGASLAQIATAKIFTSASVDAPTVHAPYASVFAFFAGCVVVGLICYTLSKDTAE